MKRGWTAWQVPSVLQPTASLAWLAMLAAAALIYAAFLRPGRYSLAGDGLFAGLLRLRRPPRDPRRVFFFGLAGSVPFSEAASGSASAGSGSSA